MTKTFLTDDRLNSVLQRVRFVPQLNEEACYRLYLMVNPHVGGKGAGNKAWIEDFKGRKTLFAKRGDLALAVACSSDFGAGSAGFFETSDGTDSLKRHGRLTECYSRAENGNVTLVGEIDLSSSAEFTIAFGLGVGAYEAAHHAWSSLKEDFDSISSTYAAKWRSWQDSLVELDETGGAPHLYRASTAMMLTHTNKSTPGAVASLSVPWGEDRGDEDLLQGAYHMVWPRDLVQHGGALLAIGAHAESCQLLNYLRATQEADGHWPQTMWLSGLAFWSGLQMDQVGQAILLADLAWCEKAMTSDQRRFYWPMLRAATQFILQNGPSTELDRWEEEEGYNAYTMSVLISSLYTGARWAFAFNDPELGARAREVAGDWNARVEGWLYVCDTELSRRLGIEGYYARILPSSCVGPPATNASSVRFTSPPPSQNGIPAHEVVSMDALALVRFGLRDPNDLRIQNTLCAIDALLKVELDNGPIWRRYNGDRFGENEDGLSFRKERKGIGRLWPLMIGERAHFELLRGRHDEASRLREAMANYATSTYLLPEQIWDADNIPEKGLIQGQPTGSVTPLLWAHGEYVKLLRSLRDGKVFDFPASP